MYRYWLAQLLYYESRFTISHFPFPKIFTQTVGTVSSPSRLYVINV